MGIKIMRSRKDPLTKYYLIKNIGKVGSQIEKKMRKRRNNNNDEISIKKDLTCDMVLLEQHVSHEATNTHYFSTFLNAIL